MNLIQALYCNQYFELKPKGKADMAKKNGTALTAIALVMYVFGFIFLAMIISPGLDEAMGDLLKDIFGRRQGRMVGRLVALVVFAAIFGIVKLVWDREPVYQATIQQFERMPEGEQARISKKGFRFFVFSLPSIALVILYAFLAS
ncbi:MAG TPA: hypothetical protein DCE41_27530 [Cytophagales bacterium]|nr:hypothetical protein [Cytophagales bacterium]HAA17969.1 hypothetical protein [Cytophagales bacterium]HAP62015.1 hypothetical protein [Cytophagales bacterium]